MAVRRTLQAAGIGATLSHNFESHTQAQARA